MGSVTRHAGRGAPWTILCIELQGPYRAQHIERIAETLRRTPGIRAQNVTIMHDRDGFSRLYYGTYRRRRDRKTGKRAIPKKLATDLKFIKELGAGPGQYMFIGATMMPKPTPDVGNPDWELTSTNAVYSLQVAVFERTDDLWDVKKAAAEFCQMLRDRGYEAYYHHARASSVVTVGSFDEKAVIPHDRGLPTYSREVVELQQQDDLLRYNRLNGRIYRARDDKGSMVPVPSRLVRVPRPGASDPW